MMFHHLVTFYLYAFSYMTNTMIGPVIAFIHDISDVLITWTRVWSETKHARLTAYSFIIVIFSWIYTRLLVFPYCIYVSTVKLHVYVSSPYVQPIFGFLLSCLFILHLYWFKLLIGIILNYAVKGEAEDL
jgi:hypothetical protein